MSGTGGVMTWDPPFGHHGLPVDAVYFAEHWYRDWPEVNDGGGLAWPADDGVVVIPMLAGNNVLQVPYRGSKAPLVGDRVRFAGGFLCDRQEDLIRLEEARSRGEVLNFCPGIWRFESFPGAVGSTYTLTRPLAAGVVPGVTAATHPPAFYLNGVLDPAAASAAGQTVTTLKAGRVGVWYMPVFRVVVLEYSPAVTDTNHLAVTFALPEVVTGDFG